MPPLFDIMAIILLVCFLMAAFGHYLFADVEPLLATLGSAMSGTCTKANVYLVKSYSQAQPNYKGWNMYLHWCVQSPVLPARINLFLIWVLSCILQECSVCCSVSRLSRCQKIWCMGRLPQLKPMDWQLSILTYGFTWFPLA